MSEPISSPNQAEVLRLQRILEETLDRYPGESEEERADALVRTLRSELSGVTGAGRASLLAALAALYPEERVATAPAAGDRRAQQRLQDEVVRLREALAAAQESATAAPKRATSTEPMVAEIVNVLVGSSRRPGAALAEGVDERMLGVLKALVELVESLARGYLSVTAEPDHTMAGHLQSVIADELEGRRPAGSVKALLEEIRHQVGNQILAFRKACDMGARELLRQIAPGALADSERGGGLFYHRKIWERFEARYEELRRADSIYETYFDGAWRRVLLSLKTQRAGTKDDDEDA
jgi:hypothetical protein